MKDECKQLNIKKTSISICICSLFQTNLEIKNTDESSLLFLESERIWKSEIVIFKRPKSRWKIINKMIKKEIKN